MSNKRRPFISDPLEAAKVAQFEVPDDEGPTEDSPAAQAPDTGVPAMPMPVPTKATPRYRVMATTKIFGRGGVTFTVHKDKIVSEADGAELISLLRDHNVPLELAD